MRYARVQEEMWETARRLEGAAASLRKAGERLELLPSDEGGSLSLAEDEGGLSLRFEHLACLDYRLLEQEEVVIKKREHKVYRVGFLEEADEGDVVDEAPTSQALPSQSIGKNLEAGAAKLDPAPGGIDQAGAVHLIDSLG
jgi:hypothetical protein